MGGREVPTDHEPFAKGSAVVKKSLETADPCDARARVRVVLANEKMIRRTLVPCTTGTCARKKKILLRRATTARPSPSYQRCRGPSRGTRLNVSPRRVFRAIPFHVVRESANVMHILSVAALGFDSGGGGGGVLHEHRTHFFYHNFLISGLPPPL